jgi:tRNA pseudouridine55 synthase
MIADALEPFLGTVQQTPPIYSAIKVGGQRLYKLARAGIEVEIASRPVEIHDIRIVECEIPSLTLEVECGKGAYMRSLAHDLGEALGCGGHVAALERLTCGAFIAESSVTPDQLAATGDGPDDWQKLLLPVDWVLRNLNSITVGQQAEQYLRHGQSVNLGQAPQNAGYLEEFRAYTNDGCFLALVRYDRSDNSWRPTKVFEVDSPSQYAPQSA